MKISINNPLQQTIVFALILVFFLLISLRKKADKTFFSLATTNELKGFAVLAVVLSHIGYFLATDTSFLFPLSIFAGVGVDLFLFLSGYGLSYSALRKDTGPWQFYKKRFAKIYWPLWLSLGAFFLLDFFLLKINYSFGYTLRAFLGLITSADLYSDINSPLWYITLTIFYYLAFPVVFRKKYPLTSASALFFLTYFLLKFPLPVTGGIAWLYSLHIVAFPVGVAFAAATTQLQLNKSLGLKAKTWTEQNTTTWLDIKIGLTCLLSLLAAYLAFNSGVGKGQWAEALNSTLIVLLIVGVAIIKPLEFKVLQLVGIYSYEIYLLHWPLMYRYDFLYKYLPAGVATALYIAIFLGLGLAIQKIISSFAKVPTLQKTKVNRA